MKNIVKCIVLVIIFIIVLAAGGGFGEYITIRIVDNPPIGIERLQNRSFWI
ncbi:MAG: hypothetical protein J5962_00210 [Lachnospiraceae bacterium]|nr:hypothetical protein [Lachnospiraceae bacterium]